ncbi:ABC transporter ATP-binding protein [Reyranella sp. CPCC 100927]|uniref:ABC transporter ATP-binding protein n=1 Tax=Reyranella sp. CPCC 100927 TaxID=2599616 RepID=UPI0011B7C00F|nr:ABC transporter ATP-binding protein [Reyranella sp. CPCC 100927]TWT10006.1 ABC transporter ATP-binding protein [Reyranella sp. CPCC 100927]
MTLAAVNVAFGYRGAPVGRGVSCAVDAGEVLCLLGPNGGGKTTLLKTLLGLIPAQGGAITIDGRALADFARPELARRLGYVPQAHNALFPFTVREVVLMGRAARVGLFSAPSAQDRDAARQALHALGIDHLADRTYTTISGGERQMTLIARALAQEPAILVMDEPTANLDFGNQTRVIEQIAKLAAQGLGILLSTHDPDHAFACADQVALLRGGDLIALGSPQETLTSDMLRRLYGVDVAVTYLTDVGRYVCTPSFNRSPRGETT